MLQRANRANYWSAGKSCSASKRLRISRLVVTAYNVVVTTVVVTAYNVVVTTYFEQFCFD